MRPLFTVHAGEFLVADHVEREFKKARVWVPTKDTGVDPLVTDLDATRSVSLQVKFSRDYLVTHLPPEFQGKLRACGWWTFDPKKLADSPAKYWVLLLVGFNNKTRDFIVLPPAELARRLKALGGKGGRIQSYVPVCGRTFDLGLNARRSYAAAGAQRCGSSASMSAAACVDTRKRTSRRYSNGFTPCASQVATSV